MGGAALCARRDEGGRNEMPGDCRQERIEKDDLNGRLENGRIRPAEIFKTIA